MTSQFHVKPHPWHVSIHLSRHAAARYKGWVTANPSRWTISLPLALLLLLAACGGGDDDGNGDASNPDGTPTPDVDWPAFFDPIDLVRASDAIVVAILHEEEVETIEAPEAEDGTTSEVTEILRSFQVEESLAGGLSVGDYFTTFSTASVVHQPPGDEPPTELAYQVLRLEPGDRVLLFMSIVVLPEFYPDEWGGLSWAAPGEPYLARIPDGDALEWETTGRYEDARDAQDIESGDNGATPEFDISLDDLRTIITGIFDGSDDAPEGPTTADPAGGEGD